MKIDNNEGAIIEPTLTLEGLPETLDDNPEETDKKESTNLEAEAELSDEKKSSTKKQTLIIPTRKHNPEADNKDIIKLVKINNEPVLSYEPSFTRDNVTYKLKEIKVIDTPVVGVQGKYESKDSLEILINFKSESPILSKYGIGTILWRNKKGTILAKENNKVINATNFHLNTKLSLKLNDYLEVINNEFKLVLKMNVFYNQAVDQNTKLIWITNTLTNSLVIKLIPTVKYEKLNRSIVNSSRKVCGEIK